MRITLIFSALVFTLPAVWAQDNEQAKGPRFHAKASQAEVLLGNAVNVSFRLENGQGGKFTQPDWEAAGFRVMGSNQSSSISIVNGVANAEATYNFAIVPLDTGTLFIPSATIREGDLEYRSEPLTLQVLPNPGRVVETPRPANPPSAPVHPAQPPKKKIKTTKI